jgi:hypothetical protein
VGIIIGFDAITLGILSFHHTSLGKNQLDFFVGNGTAWLNFASVNEGFKVSGLKACFWTPFDFGLMELHQ